jgi:glycerate-2-kinase
MKRYIKNFDELAITKERTDILTIMESAYKAIDTNVIIETNVKLDGDTLTIQDHKFNLDDFDHLYLIGFGKASSIAVGAIEKVLGDKISGGIVMDKKIGECKYVKQYICTHPRPSMENVVPSEELAKLAKKLDERDLAIVVVSGGGSSMICWPESECDQGITLYDEFLKSGGNITELNTLRKHLSLLKGGGLAKLLYPATVASLIFCDVPGDKFEEVASGPTYKDTSLVKDALAILSKYKLPFNLTLNETPKEDEYFKKVHNIPLVTNSHSVSGMEAKAKELGYHVLNIGANLYDNAEKIIEKMLDAAKPHSVVIGAGEPSVIVKGIRGITGRCEHMTMLALDKITPEDTLSSFASDGIDNLSVSAGAIADSMTLEKAAKNNLSIEQNINDNTIDEFFAQTRDQIITGETGSNVSDLMILLRK